MNAYVVSHYVIHCENAIFTTCRTKRFFSRQSPVSMRACKACCKKIICSDVRFTLANHLDGLSLCLKCQILWELESSSFTSKLCTALEYSSHRRAEVYYEASLASLDRESSRNYKLLANLLCSGRPAKLSVYAKSIYRSTKKWWQTFLVKKFFFLQSSWKHEDHSAFK